MLRYDNFFEDIFFIELKDINLMDGSGGDFNSITITLMEVRPFIAFEA